MEVGANLAAERERMKRLYESVQAIPDERWDILELQLCQNTVNAVKSDRMAATVRHNRARGKHSIDGMQNIVTDLKKRNWSDKKIGKHLGMDEDEVLRLWQIGGLAEMYKNEDFSKSWEPEVFIDNDFETIND